MINLSLSGFNQSSMVVIAENAENRKTNIVYLIVGNSVTIA